jgi:hypothetical protein
MGREMPKVKEWFRYVFFGKLYEDDEDSIWERIKSSIF